MHFPLSGVDVHPLVPPLVSFFISILTTSAGVSGAFLLLPFQMSVLGFVTPAVTPTNLLYNVVAIPGGVFRYFLEKRMAWPVAVTVIIGTLPGVFIGAMIRIRYLPDPRAIKVFAGFVLLYLGSRLFRESLRRNRTDFGSMQRTLRTGSGVDTAVVTRSISLRKVEYEFCRETFSFSPLVLLALAAVVGLVGGIYGIGGGAIIAPFLVAILGLPVYTVAGAALLGTFLTSVAGVGFFELLGAIGYAGKAPVRPDYLLGALFGVGGLFGTYFGARLQKRLPERAIRLLLGLLVTGLGVYYIGQFFR